MCSHYGKEKERIISLIKDYNKPIVLSADEAKDGPIYLKAIKQFKEELLLMLKEDK